MTNKKVAVLGMIFLPLGFLIGLGFWFAALRRLQVAKDIPNYLLLNNKRLVNLCGGIFAAVFFLILIALIANDEVFAVLNQTGDWPAVFMCFALFAPLIRLLFIPDEAQTIQ